MLDIACCTAIFFHKDAFAYLINLIKTPTPELNNISPTITKIFSYFTYFLAFLMQSLVFKVSNQLLPIK